MKRTDGSGAAEGITRLGRLADGRAAADGEFDGSNDPPG